jgi:ABC-2 type transport system ATP-binding protein
MKPAIHVSNLTKTYQSYKKRPGLLGSLRALVARERVTVHAVRDVSFSVAPGEFIGFIGPNGAGKTTTLKMLSGILWPTSGEAHVLGYVPWQRQHALQRQFAIVMGQKNQLWWDLPARDAFLLNKEIYQVSTPDFKRRIDQLAGALGVHDKLETPVRKLSLGERMKLELVNALLHSPRVLFLDEPTIGLDVISQKSIRDFLRDWNKREGTTIVLTSHQMADVQELCKRIVIIHSGSIRYDGALEQIVRQFVKHKEITVSFTKPVERDALTKFAEVVRYAPIQSTLHVPRERVRQVAKALLDQLPVDDVLVEEVPIEEVIRGIFTSMPAGAAPQNKKSSG